MEHQTGSPTVESGDRVEGIRRIGGADVAFTLAAVLTVAYYHRLACRHFFAYDDWGAAARPGALADLLEAVQQPSQPGPPGRVPLDVPRLRTGALRTLQTLGHQLPSLRWRRASTSTCCGRLGAWRALVLAMAVLWGSSSLQLTRVPLQLPPCATPWCHLCSCPPVMHDPGRCNAGCRPHRRLVHVGCGSSRWLAACAVHCPAQRLSCATLARCRGARGWLGAVVGVPRSTRRARGSGSLRDGVRVGGWTVSFGSF